MENTPEVTVKTEDGQNTATAETKATKPRGAKKPSGVPEVAGKYKLAGWAVQVLTNRGAVDIIASRGEKSRQKVHFVRVFESHTGVLKPENKSNEENNNYIQNAFSNMAIPVYAFANYNENKAVFDRISLMDINSNMNLRLILEKKSDEPVAKSVSAPKIATKKSTAVGVKGGANETSRRRGS